MQKLPPLMQAAISSAATEMATFDNIAANLITQQNQRYSVTNAQIQKIRAHLFASGINLRQFCEEKGCDYQVARSLLCGKARGRRGEAHKAAIALGLKPIPKNLELAA